RVATAEVRVLGAVFQEGAGHPVVTVRAGEVLHRLAEVAPQRRRPALARRPDKHEGKTRLKRQPDEGRRALAGPALAAAALRIDLRPRLQRVERARGAPRPGPERAPLLGRAALAAIGQADDTGREPRAVVGLDAARAQGEITPARRDELLLGGRPLRL